MNIKESAPIIKSHIRGVRYVICSWEYYTFPRKSLYYLYSMKLKRTTWWRRGSVVEKSLYSTSAYEAKSFCEVSNLSKRALQSFVKARPSRFVNSFKMGIFHENAIGNRNQGVIKLQKGRAWGCKFYEKITSKHCKLRCFMAPTCLKPR